jgi:acetyltransferase/esterase
MVTYDRRCFSRSHLTGQPAIVFGNSSGAIVALEVLTHAPKQVQMVVAHEPSVVLLLPDAAKWLAFFDEVYDPSGDRAFYDKARE